MADGNPPSVDLDNAPLWAVSVGIISKEMELLYSIADLEHLTPPIRYVLRIGRIFHGLELLSQNHHELFPQLLLGIDVLQEE